MNAYRGTGLNKKSAPSRWYRPGGVFASWNRVAEPKANTSRTWGRTVAHLLSVKTGGRHNGYNNTYLLYREKRECQEICRGDAILRNCPGDPCRGGEYQVRIFFKFTLPVLGELFTFSVEGTTVDINNAINDIEAN